MQGYFGQGYFDQGYFQQPYFGGELDPTTVAWLDSAVDQPPYSGLHYPFIAPVALEAAILNDFWLSYEDDADAFVAPFRIGFLYGFGQVVNTPVGSWPTPTHIRDLVVLDANDEIVFDSSQADFFSTNLWSGVLRVTEWRTDSAVCRCTAPLGWPREQGSDPRTIFIEPVNGELDPRTYSRRPRQFRGFVIAGNEVASTHIRLAEGYNIALTPTEQEEIDGERLKTELLIAAVPGAGLGRFPGCEDDTPKLRTINRVGPDETGAFTLDASDCLRVNRPTRQIDNDLPPTLEYYHSGLTAEEAAAALLLSNDCDSCCSCDQYHNVYVALSRVWSRAKTAGTNADLLRRTQEKFRDRWLAQKECREARAIQSILRNEPGKKFSLSTAYCNKTAACLSPFELRLDFTVYDRGTPVLTSGELCGPAYIESRGLQGEQRYALLGAWPTLSAVFDRLDGYDSAQLRFRLCLPAATPTFSLAVKITAHTPDPEADQDGVVWTLPTFPAEVTTSNGPTRAVETYISAIDLSPPSALACEC